MHDIVATACIMSTGEEVLRGELIDSNSASLSQLLEESGLAVQAMFTVGDRREDLVWAIESALQRAEYLFITGGLGPTTDDLTTEVVADLAEVELFFHEPSWRYIEGKFQEFNIPLTENNRKQALFPQGANVLPNPNGTAPGFSFQLQRGGTTRTIIALPGPPREMQPMAESFVATIPGVSSPSHLFMRFFGIGESSLSETLGPWAEQNNEELGFRHLFPEVEAKLYDATPRARDSLRAYVLENLGDVLVDFSRHSIPDLFAQYLQASGQTFATAESCTGGLVGKLITDAPGASEYFRGSVVSYHNDLKTSLLGVPEDVIAQWGAVSQQSAEAMAAGVRERTGADLTLSVTGIAGPGGGTDEKPVGTVWLGRATAQGIDSRQARVFPGRERVRICSAYEGMRWLMTDWLAQRWRTGDR
ncbi:MAG: CinA family nicotinamide mononucleotide deamidase-related protein [Pseudomonadota bacterium]|nr:CinA family nicotinamide mononucleotide deamidase-related protein [Pseudomonadota bacterium]